MSEKQKKEGRNERINKTMEKTYLASRTDVFVAFDTTSDTPIRQ